jgi:KRAB domain-containing zinc finger protein|uniref:C2H2-type domain-containing protein n=1 Tax=Daphnia galeata TaxID=27404 RepID=A0A8J2W367_9CRUS|nr:unnamed protein product [Daphnia galeata]
MEQRDLQFNLASNFSSRMNSSSCSYYGNNRNTDTYPDFEGVQDLSYSAQCMQEQNVPAHEDQDVTCMDLSLLLSSSKACDRQQIEDELPLNLTGKAREDEINRRLRQRQQFCNYSYPFSDPPRSSQVFVAPDFLGMHELQDLRTHIYMDDATSLNLTYCPQTLDLSAQSLDLSLTGQELQYDNSTVDLSASHSLNLDACTGCDILNLTCHQGGSESETSNMIGLAMIHQQQQPLPPASSLPLPLSITQSLTPTSCSSQQYTALDLQKNSCASTVSTAAAAQQVTVEEKRYMCALCAAHFVTTQELIAHRDTHLNAKPFACDQCGMRFMKVGTLNRHVKATHANSRPYQCEMCEKKFAQKHDLQRHIRTHKRK